METTIVVGGVPYIFVTTEGSTALKVEAETTESKDVKPKPVQIPSIWLITRINGVPLFGLEPDVEDKSFRIMTAEKLYAEKSQWFEPLADNYKKLIWLNAESIQVGSEAYVAYKHFEWQEIIDYANVDRPSIAYAKQSYADWKVRSAGGDGYLMVFVKDKPYWADGIGQIPFAVDTYRLYLERYQDVDTAIKETIVTGIQFGDGMPLGAKEDEKNEYDNFIILRAALWASENFKLTIVHHAASPIRSTEKEMNTVSIPYVPTSTVRLENPIPQGELDKYGIWNKQVGNK